MSEQLDVIEYSQRPSELASSRLVFLVTRGAMGCCGSKGDMQADADKVPLPTDRAYMYLHAFAFPTRATAVTIRPSPHCARRETDTLSRDSNEGVWGWAITQ